MFDGWGSLVFLVFLAIFAYLVLFTGKKEGGDGKATGKGSAPRRDDERRDRAIAELEERVERARRRRAAMSADLDDDPEAAARTLRRMMKRR